MRFFSKVLSSSVSFTGLTTPFSTTGVIAAIPTSGTITPTTAVFASQGSLGGPTKIDYASGLSIQGLFSANPAIIASSGTLGTLSLLVSNTLEAGKFVVASSVAVATTGSYMLKDTGSFYKYVDYGFTPNTAFSSTAFVTVNLCVKGIS